MLEMAYLTVFGLGALIGGVYLFERWQKKRSH